MTPRTTRRHIRTRNWRFLAALLSAVGISGGLGAATAAEGQLFGQSTTVYENCRVLQPDGSWLDDAIITVRGDRIVSIQFRGAGDPAPADAPRSTAVAAGRDRVTRVDLDGASVTPGLIDVTDLIINTSAAGHDASMRAVDAIDRYASDQVQEAFAQGITAGFIPARGGSGVNGMGAIVRLTANPGGSYGQALVEEHALSINLGSGDGPIQRLQTVDSLRQSFRNALAYRESFEIYEEELEEYAKKIRERAQSSGTGNTSRESGSQQQPQQQQPPSQRQRPGGGSRPRTAEGESPLVEDPPWRDHEGGTQRSFVDEVSQDDSASDPLQGRPPRRPPGGPPAQQSQRPQDQQRGDDSGKPVKPQYNAAHEAMLRAIDRKVPVRFVAHRSEDILNALEIAEEFGLRAVIEGGAEAGRIAARIVAAGADVVLDYDSGGHAPARGVERLLDDNIRALAEAGAVPGVDWVFGSARGSGVRGRFLLMQGAIASQQAARAYASAHGPTNQGRLTTPLTLLTSDAAAFLGVDDRIGRLAPGNLADFVIWSDDPLQPAAQVTTVVVGGRSVYEASGSREPQTDRRSAVAETAMTRPQSEPPELGEGRRDRATPPNAASAVRHVASAIRHPEVGPSRADSSPRQVTRGAREPHSIRRSQDPAPGAGRTTVVARRMLMPDGTIAENRALVIDADGRIVRVIDAGEADPASTIARFDHGVLSPGLIDVNGSAGVRGQTDEQFAAIDPDASVIDAFDRSAIELRRALRAGVTAIMLSPAPTNVIPGRSATVRTAVSDPAATDRRSAVADQWILRDESGLSVVLSSSAFSVNREPSSRAGALAMLRRTIDSVEREEARARAVEGNSDRRSVVAGPSRDRSPLARALAGELPVIITCEEAQDVINALLVFGQRGLSPVIIHTAEASVVAEEAVEEGMTIVVGPYSFNDSTDTLRGAAALERAGATVVLSGDVGVGDPDRLRITAALAARNGLSPEQARRAITTDAALVAGVADQIGSLEPGRWADFIIFSGDPLMLDSGVREVWIAGRRVWSADVIRYNPDQVIGATYED